MESRFLVAWSGGIDSTYCLWWALNEIDGGYLTAKHIQLINREGRHQAEWAAIQRIMPLMKKYGNFDLSVSTLDVMSDSKPRFMLRDHFYMLTILFGAAINHIYNKQLRTTIITGNDNVIKSTLIKYYSKSYKLMRELHPNISPRLYTSPSILMPVFYYNRNKQVKEMPYEIAIQTHSCRKPIKISDKWLNCGNCMVCKKLKLKKRSFTNRSYIDRVKKIK